jgi:hypothetical protein
MPRSAERQGLSLGVLAQSRKANERRLPIHRISAGSIIGPAANIPRHGYGEHFGNADGALAELVGGISTREHWIASCDIVLLPRCRPKIWRK